MSPLALYENMLLQTARFARVGSAVAVDPCFQPYQRQRQQQTSINHQHHQPQPFVLVAASLVNT